MSRPLWRGAINFGLVNIPVDLVTAVRPKAVNFHMLSKDGTCRLRRKLYCPETGKEFDFHQTARGVEIGPENYAIVDQREIQRLKPEKGRAIEILQFVELSAVDPVFYERVYYLKPSAEATKAYRLLVEALHEAKMCAIARFVMREKQYIAVIRTLEDGLVLHTLHYADEVQPIDEVAPGGKAKVNPQELAVAEQLIKAMTRPLDIEEFRDEYREELQRLIDAKVKGKKLVQVADDEPEPSVRPSSLMDALRRSLAGADSPRPAAKHRTARKTGRSKRPRTPRRPARR